MMPINPFEFEINDMEIMETKVIVLWGDDNLLLGAVELFLNARETWKVVRFSNECDDGTLIQEMAGVHPDDFILDEGTFFKKLHLLTKFMQDFPKLKVITLNPNNNCVEVYSKQNILIQSASDLISVVEAKPVIQNLNKKSGETLQQKGDQMH